MPAMIEVTSRRHDVRWCVNRPAPVTERDHKSPDHPHCTLVRRRDIHRALALYVGANLELVGTGEEHGKIIFSHMKAAVNRL